MADCKNSKEGRIVSQKYADILRLSRPEPLEKHPRMSLTNRAKIFSPSRPCAVSMMKFPARVQISYLSKRSNCQMIKRVICPTSSSKSERA